MSKFNWITKPQCFPPLCQLKIQLSSHWLLMTQILKHIWGLFCVVFFRQPLPSSFSVDPHSFQSQIQIHSLGGPRLLHDILWFFFWHPLPTTHTFHSGHATLTLLEHIVLCLVGSFIYSPFLSYHQRYQQSIYEHYA